MSLAIWVSRHLHTLLYPILLVGLGFGFACHAEQVASLDTAKAAYVYNFLKFGEWPAEVFPRPDTPFVICVHAISANLEAAVGKLAGRSAQGRTISVRDDVSWPQAGECHVLLLGENLSDKVRRIQGPILTVGQSAHFVEQGGMVGLLVEDDTLVFDVNLTSLNRANLFLSSKLLRLARKTLK